MNVILNGESTELERPMHLEALLQVFSIDAERGVAIAVNGMVIPRREWTHKELAAGDEIEVIRATQGG